MDYKFRFMDDNMKTEVDELLQGEHQKTITAFAFECGNAAVEGYKQACAKRGLIAVGCGLLTFGAVKVGKKIVDNCKKKKLNESKKYIKVDS